jgi:hypothetical protein
MIYLIKMLRGEILMKKISLVIIVLLCLSFVSALKIQIISEGVRGNMNLLGGADAKCQAEFGENYRALVAQFDDTTPVLNPNTVYTRADGKTIGKTNSDGCFSFPLENPVSDQKITVWTGLEADCSNEKNTNDCYNWTTKSTGANLRGAVGEASAVSSNMISVNGTSFQCEHSLKVYCVEQGSAPVPEEKPKEEVNVTNNVTQPAPKQETNVTPPKANASVNLTNGSAEAGQKSSNLWMWIIGGVVLVIIIVAVVMIATRKKKPF